MRGHRAARFLVSIAVVLAGRVAAQDARIVAANSSNGRILEISFEPPGSTVLNTDASGRLDLQSLVFRADGADGVRLIAADRKAGRLLFYAQSVGAAVTLLDAGTPGRPPYPDGLSLDSNDNLFGTTSATGSGADKDARVWVLRRDAGCTGCLPGGYVGPVGTIDGNVQVTLSLGGVPTLVTVELLRETRIVPASKGSLVAGDLLVLASDPPALLRYRSADLTSFLAQLALGGTPPELAPDVLIFPANADAPAASRFPAGADPAGMDLTPQGNLLVPSGKGSILAYRPDMTRLSNTGGFVDFASGLGNGKFKLAVGPQDGVFRAFVADRNGGDVLRFDIQADGTGLSDGVVSDPEFPVAIATTTASVVPTPAGPGIKIQPTNLMETTVENVVVGGTTGVTVYLFEDPRETEVSTPPGLALHRPLLLSEIHADLPPLAEIPAYVRAFRQGDPQLGPALFILLVADSNVQVQGVLKHVIEESLVLGYEPDCDDLDATAQPRMFWVPKEGEPPILESPRFIDITNDCGTTRGMMRYWSLFLAGRDTRPTTEIAETKLDALRLVLDAATCVDVRLSKALHRRLGAAIRYFEGNKLQRVPGPGSYRYSSAIDELRAFSNLIQSFPGAFSSCSVNEGGELRARAESAIFVLQKLE